MEIDLNARLEQLERDLILVKSKLVTAEIERDDIRSWMTEQSTQLAKSKANEVALNAHIVALERTLTELK